MVSIVIDGKRLQVSESENVLECALKNEIYIPHLCHHPDLEDIGSCRLCLVEVEGQEEVVTSCTLKPYEGMVINTKSERINKLRNLSLELILAGHPEECTTCPKYGNCELQTVIQYIGANNSRMKIRNKGFEPEKENPLLVHDMNRCILCGRCVRVCNELRGVGVLQYKKKGMETCISTLHDKLLKDEDCRFCTACAEVCPTGAIRDKKQLSEISSNREEALVPCRNACPAHTDIPRYIRFVKEGKYDEAAAVIREKVPFPKVLGHICNHECEMQCKRLEVNEAMSIRNIKRYAAEHDTGKYWRKRGKQLPDTDKRVCVVGAGPAGLTAAYYLRKQGHSVTLKEALPMVGGMMYYGIPEYRLPRNIIAEEAMVIVDTGVVIEVNERVENPVQLKNDYDAVLMAIGTHKGVKLPIAGSDLEGTLLNIDFLRNASMGKETGMGKKVVVLGGGNVAFDCARTAKRLGASEIHLACLEARDVMTADEEEIMQAQEEGIFVHPAKSFESINGSDKVTGVTFMNVKSFTFDENRHAIIEKEENSQMTIEADTVIFAVGQRSDINEEVGLELGRANSILVNEKTFMTGVEGIFAAGDTIYGTKSVIQAIESGRQAASEIDKYLGGDGDISEKFAPEEEVDNYIGVISGFGYEKRVETIIEKSEEHRDNFGLIDHGISSSDIQKEASRCLQCDLRCKITRPRLWSDYVEEQGVK